LEKLYGVSTEEAFTELLLVNCVEVAACLIFMFYMDVEAVGRRGAMLTAWGLVVLCSCVAIFVDGNRLVFQTVNLICKGAVAAAFTVVYVYAGELLPSTVRTSVISVGGSFGRIATMGAPGILTALLDANVDLVYGFYVGMATMAFVAGVLQYRETLGEPLLVYSCDLRPKIEEMQQLSWGDRYFPIFARLRGGQVKSAPYTPLG
jgi:MFS family permease